MRFFGLHFKAIIVLVFALLLGVAGASFAQSATPRQNAPADAGTVPARPAIGGIPESAQAAYRFGVADKVRLIVFNEPTLSGEFTVSSDGTLSLPLIGAVPVRGKTAIEVMTEITEKFADGYLRNPRISIDVLTYRPFYILGEVGKPGEYPYSNGLSAINAVATAEGFTYRANKKKIFIKRAGETEERQYKLTPDLMVQPGDTVRIGERYF